MNNIRLGVLRYLKRMFASRYIPPKYNCPTCVGAGSLRREKWKKITYMGAIPVVGIMSLFVLLSIRSSPDEDRPPFVKYEYMRIRHKPFPWGDGNKTFFHNREMNALPNGYEDN